MDLREGQEPAGEAVISQAGINLIKSFEGCRLEAYLDGGGVWTIGYGHTGPGVKAGLRWSQERANAQLAADIQSCAAPVLASCKVEPNENQLAAMVSLAYNIGPTAFRSSSVLRFHNDRKFAEAANAFGMWKKDNGEVVAGLVRRRAAEAQLYLTPVSLDEPAQTTRAQPVVDDPAAKVDLAKVATAASVVAGTAQQVVANVSAVWDTINSWGIEPRVVMLALGAAGVVAFGYFVWETYQRRKDGDR